MTFPISKDFPGFAEIVAKTFSEGISIIRSVVDNPEYKGLRLEIKECSNSEYNSIEHYVSGLIKAKQARFADVDSTNEGAFLSFAK
jgi:hypothetical protein